MSTPTSQLRETLIKQMTDRFLGWKLPDTFSPDAGISFTKVYNEQSPMGPSAHTPTGTNLFTATEAEEMVRYMLEGTDLASEVARAREADMKLIKWLLSDDTGLSSMSLVEHMLGLEVTGRAPSDKWDRARCVRLLRLMPEWIDRLAEMKQYSGWQDQVGLIAEELLSTPSTTDKPNQ